MGSTYLSLVNRVLAHFNEVQLNSTNFATATGFYQVAKDAVNDSIRQIQQAEYEWPFNWQETTQTLTPTSSITGHTVAYPLPTGTISFETVDWESFKLVRDDTLEVPAKHLPYMDYNEYLQRQQSQDLNIDYNDTGIRLPQKISRSQDDNIIVTPPPDRAYQIQYEWWGYETSMTSHGDTTTIPERFDHVIHKGALGLCYDFRGDQIRSSKYTKEQEKGIFKMRELLINRFKKMRDKRVPNRAG